MNESINVKNEQLLVAVEALNRMAVYWFESANGYDMQFELNRAECWELARDAMAEMKRIEMENG